VTVSVNTLDEFIRQPVLLVYNFFIILAIHTYLKQPLQKTFWLFPLWFTVFYAALFFSNEQGVYVLFLLSFPIATLYWMTVAKKSIREGNNKGKIIFYMGWFSLVATLLFTIIYTMPLFIPQRLLVGEVLEILNLIRITTLNLNFLSMSLGLSLIFAHDFGLTNRSLEMKTQEVEQLATEKTRIVADMHDDIGSDLSALNLKAEIIRQKVNAGQKPSKEIDNLVGSTLDIAKKVRDVIWTVNVRHDSLPSVINYFDTYADDFFETTNFVLKTSLPLSIPNLIIKGDSRHVLFMCFKEALNNVLKHAKASILKIDYTIDNQEFKIAIQDNGVGFDPALLQQSSGNGLQNLQERLLTIGGQCLIQTSPQGTLVVFSLPIP
jgi:signal transduction histidine kinase